MRRLIFILIAIIGVSQAQTIQYIGAPTTTVISRGNFRTDSIFYLPKRSKAPTDTAAFRYQISDSSLYVWTGSQWIKAGGSGTISGSGITGYIPQFSASTTLDTSALFTIGNRLGIGSSTFAYTSTNTANIELNGTAGGILGFKRNDSARGYLWHTGDNMELANTTAGSISFNTNSATRGSISSAGVWRLHNLAGTGDRVVVASSNGTLSASTSVTGLVDTTTISTRAWRQKGIDSVVSIIPAAGVGGSGTTNYIPKFTASGTIGNSQIFDNGTNVGLGTASPGAKFHLLSATGTAQTQGDYANNLAIMQGASRTGTTAVGGSFATTLSLQSNDDVITAGSGASIGFAAKWNTGLYSSAAQFGSIFGGKENSTDANLAGYLSFATRPAGGNPTERLRITSGGNVGVGTNNPVQKFVVSNSGSEGFEFVPGASSNSNQLLSYNRATSAYSDLVTRAATYNIQIGTTNAAYIFANGRVGINTTTDAGYQLDVNGTARINNALQVNKSDGGQAINIVGNSNTASIQQNGSDMYFNSNTNTTGGGFFFRNSSSFTTRMAIDASGNVGIGTASPIRKLSINVSPSSTTDDGLSISNGTDFFILSKVGSSYSAYGVSPDASIIYHNNGKNISFVNDGSGGGVTFHNSTLNEYARFNSSGELMLRTTVDSGAYSLQINGNQFLSSASDNAFITLRTISTKSPYVEYKRGTAQTWWVGAGINGDNNFSWYDLSNNSFRMTLNTANELLLNTTTDAGDYKLQVSGNALVTAGKLDITTNTAFGLSVSRSGTSVVGGQINNSNGILYYGAESSTGGGLFTGSSAYAAVIGSGAAYPLQFATDNVTRATINTNGELLIATTTDNGDFKLQVNGSALISGSIQTANPVSGTAVPWRLGSVVATSVQLDTGNYVEVNINGTFYRLAIVTPL